SPFARMRSSVIWPPLPTWCGCGATPGQPAGHVRKVPGRCDRLVTAVHTPPRAPLRTIRFPRPPCKRPASRARVAPPATGPGPPPWGGRPRCLRTHQSRVVPVVASLRKQGRLRALDTRENLPMTKHDPLWLFDPVLLPDEDPLDDRRAEVASSAEGAGEGAL